MPSDDTIYIGIIFVDLTLENIRKTKKATFMASKQVEPDYWKHLEETGQKLHPVGYRYYCTLIEETKDQQIMDSICSKLKERTNKKIANSLSSIMLFKIDKIREISF